MNREIIRWAVVPAAGLGTRLLPITIGKPKEMIRIHTLDKNGHLCFKPLLQITFERLYEFGVRDFCFIINEAKNSIKDYFTINGDLVKESSKENKLQADVALLDFYEKLSLSRLAFVNQPTPRGFGDAVLRAEPNVEGPFLVHAGDNYILSKEHHYLERLLTIHRDFKSDATFIVKEVENTKSFGIAEGNEVSNGVYQVQRVAEKPQKATTNLGIIALYVFEPSIFDALKRTQVDSKGELQLTDAIQTLLNSGHKAMAVKLDKEEHWFDIGTPQSYQAALAQSRRYFQCLGNTEIILG